MEKLKYILSIAFMLSLLSCGGGGDDAPALPSVATLVFPLNNEECNSGVSVNTTQSSVNFQWNISANSTSYTVVFKNLLTNSESSINSSTNQVDITINKSTPYKWWVISKTTESLETAKSAEWKFYNSGDAIQTYAPFPAGIVAPVMGSIISGTTVNLEWVGSDVDNDIKEYEVYFGTTELPTNKIETVVSQRVDNVSVSVNTYYWKILTRDDEGNTSTSQVFQFKVE